MDDKDVSATVERPLFEELAKPLFDRVRAPVDAALKMAGVTPKEVDFVEIIGGSTRVPAVKELLVNVFGQGTCPIDGQLICGLWSTKKS